MAAAWLPWLFVGVAGVAGVAALFERWRGRTIRENALWAAFSLSFSVWLVLSAEDSATAVFGFGWFVLGAYFAFKANAGYRDRGKEEGEERADEDGTEQPRPQGDDGRDLI